MKLLFDARYIRPGFHDGVSRYSTELGRALAALTPVTFIISDPAQRAKLPSDAPVIMLHAPTSLREPLSARILNRYHPDIVVSPMQTIGSGGRKFKLILTSHDLIYYRHRTPPRYFHPLLRLGWRLYHLSYVPQRYALNRADAIAAVSSTTAHDLRRTHLTKRPIVVATNAPEDLSHYVDKVDQSAAPRDLIYMGSFMPYKNVDTLIRAMADLPDYTLHLLSRITLRREAILRQLIPASAKVIFHHGVSDQEYAELLAKRSILVTASLDEGFGLPIAEALSLGVPAVVSDIEIFHEVAGDGALYFPARDSVAFARAVRQLDDTKTRQALIRRGKKYITRFTWEASARALLETIQSLLQS